VYIQFYGAETRISLLKSILDGPMNTNNGICRWSQFHNGHPKLYMKI
jgi:hypothetical protein